MLGLQMGALKELFSVISKFPLNGPDGGFEADLLLCSAKPVGLLVDVMVPPDVIEDYSPVMEKIRNDIQRLKSAVNNGMLLHHTFTTNDQQSGFTHIWNLYSQTDKEQDLIELGELLLSDLENREPNIPIPKSHGEYFGYSDADIKLFANGGYDSLPFPIKNFFKATHDFRLKCRISTKLGKEFSDLAL